MPKLSFMQYIIILGLCAPIVTVHILSSSPFDAPFFPIYTASVHMVLYCTSTQLNIQQMVDHSSQQLEKRDLKCWRDLHVMVTKLQESDL